MPVYWVGHKSANLSRFGPCESCSTNKAWRVGASSGIDFIHNSVNNSFDYIELSITSTLDSKMTYMECKHGGEDSEVLMYFKLFQLQWLLQTRHVPNEVEDINAH